MAVKKNTTNNTELINEQNFAVIEGEITFIDIHGKVANIGIKNRYTANDKQFSASVVVKSFDDVSSLTKGMHVAVECKFTTRSYDDKTTGKKKYVSELVASDIEVR